VAIWTLVLVDSWQWTPFVFVVVYARLQALPQEVFEAGSAQDRKRPALMADQARGTHHAGGERNRAALDRQQFGQRPVLGFVVWRPVGSGL
jgi:hypothetical protein